MADYTNLGDTLHVKRRDLAAATAAIRDARYPSHDSVYGQHLITGDDSDCTENHFLYLSEAVRLRKQRMFTEYGEWFRARMISLNLGVSAFENDLECMKIAVDAQFTPVQVCRINTYIDAALNALRQPECLETSFIESTNPFSDFAGDYLNLLLAANRRDASRLVLEACADGTSIKDIYLWVFQPTQYEIGRLWQINQLTVGQEHYCTAATQLIMSQLYPYLFATEKSGRRMIATCVAGETHEIGVRMIADFFELDGWNTYYLGADTPLESIVKLIRESGAELLCVGATMPYHLPTVRKLIRRIRNQHDIAAINVLVGGYPFRVAPDASTEIGADGTADNADDTIALASRLVS